MADNRRRGFVMRRFVLGVLPKVLDISRFERYHIQAETETKGGNAMALFGILRLLTVVSAATAVWS